MDFAPSMATAAADGAAIPGAPEALLPVSDLVVLGLLGIGLPILLVEIAWLWWQRKLDRQRLTGMLTSLFCLLPATAVEVLLTGVLIGLFYGAAAIAPWTIPTSWATAALCLLLVDLVYYGDHRLGHRINALWSLYHSVHHSGDHFDQTIAARISFVDFFFSPLFYLPLVLVGFHPLLVLTCLGLVLAWQQWIHTELVGRLRWLDPWLNTPSNHRVHHGRNPQYIDKNYGGILIVWDRLFGTYAAEVEPVDYGLTEQLVSRNPIAVHTHGAVKLWRALTAAPSLRAAATVLFAGPEMTPSPAAGRPQSRDGGGRARP